MTAVFDNDARDRLIHRLDTTILSSGKGTIESACSVASINLAHTGELTDVVPDCMSLVIGEWIKVIQDGMPSEMRNSDEWKKWLVESAGTGRNIEHERLEIVLNWMWVVVLPQLQPVANELGFGDKWTAMLRLKTVKAADRAAADADRAAAYAAAAYAADDAAAYAADDAADAAADAARAAAYAAAYAADAAALAADFWQTINPPKLLADLVLVIK